MNQKNPKSLSNTPGAFRLGGFKGPNMEKGMSVPRWGRPHFHLHFPTVTYGPLISNLFLRSHLWKYYYYDPYTQSWYHPIMMKQIENNPYQKIQMDGSRTDGINTYSVEDMIRHLREHGYNEEEPISKEYIHQVLAKMAAIGRLGKMHIQKLDGKRSWGPIYQFDIHHIQMEGLKEITRESMLHSRHLSQYQQRSHHPRQQTLRSSSSSDTGGTQTNDIVGQRDEKISPSITSLQNKEGGGGSSCIIS